MTYPVTFFANCFDNLVTERHTFDWPEFCELLSVHTATDDKNTMMVCPAEFIASVDGSAVRRCADNVSAYSMLALDIDGDFSIPMFRAKFRRWRYVAYTTYSHRMAKKQGRDAFRAFFPLSDPIPAAVLRALKPEIADWAGVGDESQLDTSRGFYVPSCPPDRLPLAQAWVNEGEVLDWSRWCNQAAIRIEAELSAPPPAPSEMNDDQRRKLLDKLRMVYLGQEPAWWRVGVAMVGNGFSLEDFKYVSIGGLMRQKTAQDCDQKWKHCVADVSRGKTIHVGYLWNIANGKH